MEQNVKLQKNLSSLNVWSLAVGCIIGWGAFVMPANTFLPKAGPLGTLIAMAAASIIMISIAFNYYYMINRFPVAGGEFAFSKASFGQTTGFICAWFLGLSYLAIVPLNATALALIGRNLFPFLTQWGKLYTVFGYDIYAGEIILAVLALVVFAILNIKGVSTTGKFQTFLALGLVGAVVLLLIFCLFNDNTSIKNLSPAFPSTAKGDYMGGILAVVAVAPWAFVGFDTIPQSAEEFKFSPKKTKVIMVLSILIGGLLYIVLNTITAATVPSGYAGWEEYIEASKNASGITALPTFNAAKLILGDVGLIILGVALFCAVLSGIVGFYMATSRLLYSMGKDKVLPGWFAKLHPKYKTPYLAILFVLVISLVAPWFGRTVLGWIVDMSSIGAAIGYGLTCAAAFVQMRKNKDASVLLQINAILGTLFSIFFAALLVIPNPWAYLGKESRYALFAWIIIGAIFFITTKIKAKNKAK